MGHVKGRDGAEDGAMGRRTRGDGEEDVEEMEEDYWSLSSTSEVSSDPER